MRHIQDVNMIDVEDNSHAKAIKSMEEKLEMGQKLPNSGSPSTKSPSGSPAEIPSTDTAANGLIAAASASNSKASAPKSACTKVNTSVEKNGKDASSQEGINLHSPITPPVTGAKQALGGKASVRENLASSTQQRGTPRATTLSEEIKRIQAKKVVVEASLPFVPEKASSSSLCFVDLTTTSRPHLGATQEPCAGVTSTKDSKGVACAGLRANAARENPAPSAAAPSSGPAAPGSTTEGQTAARPLPAGGGPPKGPSTLLNRARQANLPPEWPCSGLGKGDKGVHIHRPPPPKAQPPLPHPLCCSGLWGVHSPLDFIVDLEHEEAAAKLRDESENVRKLESEHPNLFE
ncbi:unnamed protein product, partial [Amoebophrya sp. A25]|eukprot:GSA25T00007909001.1